MSCSAIPGNTTDLSSLFINYNSTFRLSGSAKIGTLVLSANNATTRSRVTINGSYSGTVSSLHLGGFAIDIAQLWTNAPVIVNGTAGVISMFNNGGLGNFANYYLAFWGEISIRAT
jgi:hypothetical protein